MDPQALKPLYETLHRYAGWLDRDRSSVNVRTDVEAVGAAIDRGRNPTAQLQTLDLALARLPGGELRKMLREASAKIRRAAEERP